MKLRQKMDEAEERLVLDNMGLVPYLAGTRLDVFQDSPYYSDIIDAGVVGLNQAARFYSPKLSIPFSTYARKCILTEMVLMLRQIRRNNREVSINESICSGGDIVDKRNFFHEIESRDQFVNTVNTILNMDTIDKLVLLYRISGITQKQISKRLGKSQPYISRVQRKAINELENRHCASMVWVFEIVGGKFYRFTYNTKDDEDYRKAWRIFDKVQIECAVDFKKNSYVAIEFLADDDSFAAIAEIIRKMELN